jgi:hypothetical protein
VLAFGMILRWRAAMYLRFRRLVAEEPAGAHATSRARPGRPRRNRGAPSRDGPTAGPR